MTELVRPGSFALQGKRALVTGASAGLGAHFAQVLSAAGAEVVLAARRVDRIQSLAEQIRTSGGSANAICLDVSSPRAVAEALAAAGPLDVVVNNAGISIPGPVLEQSEHDWDQMMNINLKGAWLIATEAARRMLAAGIAGSIINIASILGIRQSSQVTGYAVSKAAVLQLTRQLALELARHQIRVNAIAPGYFRTDMNDEFFSGPAGQAVMKRIPQRRLGRLVDLDGPLLLLASEASRYMTGATLAVDGGHLVSQL